MQRLKDEMTGGQSLVRVVVTSSHRLLQCNYRLRLEDVYPESSLFRQALHEFCLSPAPPLAGASQSQTNCAVIPHVFIK